ncbi:permease [Lentzea pudingi]|uniref:Permease n=1 Tax=Lentzea pudingi TaxID=1789439 RepID=A0ABQ2IT30_9PSEU|nr:permease [Lentzea pudingi]GGN24501.1 permease [Lentzea pudingi]
MTITGEIRSSKRRSGGPRLKITSLEVLCGILVLALLFQSRLVDLLDVPKLRTASTVFVAICVQAMPFLVLGVLISGAIAAFVPASALRRLLPSKTALAVPVAGVAGIALPGCECASVPVAKRLMQQGVAPAVALTFLLAAPAVNPIVLVSTAVAFNDAPMMVVARFAGSLLTAMVMGWLWVRFGKMEWIAERALARMADHTGRSKWAVFAESSRHDLVDAGGFLVLGGLFAAVFKTFVPTAWMQTLGGQIVLGVIVMALLAVVLALCSEADAFVAVAFSALPLLPRLVFLVVGPAVDVKLIALQAGAFGKSFAFRFAPATFVVAILCAVVSGVVLL